MVALIPSAKATETLLLETLNLKFPKVYITSRLESVTVIARERLKNSLNDLGMVQLEQL